MTKQGNNYDCIVDKKKYNRSYQMIKSKVTTEIEKKKALIFDVKSVQ